MYKALIRPLLFLFQPEKAHHLTFSLLRWLHYIPGMKSLFSLIFNFRDKRLEYEFCGMKLPNRVGLAAGFDKNAKALHPFSGIGFGFIEVGTVTPKAQPGNEKPRLFRIPSDRALINRMGFNNEGLEPMIERLKNRPHGLIVGGNIGKNKITPNETAYTDYETCLEALHPYVDYFVVNISSPNTPNLRDLQEKEPLKELLDKVKMKLAELKATQPLLLKIAPDLTDGQLNDICEIVHETGIDGIVATNTTISREKLSISRERIDNIGPGGLSGTPVKKRSDEVIRFLRRKLGNKFPLMGVGGIMSPTDAVDKIRAGADVIQVYTGFIYEGPSFVKRINKAILKEIEQ